MKSYNYSYNVLINRLEAFAAGHFLIRRFTHGQIDMSDQLQDDQYPFMHVTPDTIEPVPGAMNFGFHIMFADIPRDKEYKAEYQREVISDCIRLGQDLIAEVKNGLELFGFDVQLLETPTFEPFMEEQKNTVTGVAFTLKLSVPWDWSACDIPAIWAVGGASGTGGEGTGYGITLRTNGVDNVVQTLLDLVEGTNITITDLGNGQVQIDSTGGGGGGGEFVSTEYNANHTTATGNQYVIGDRVWYNGNVYRCIANNDALLPTNTTYWTLVAVGYRLRQSPVDWNATSGDYQILNKPTIITPVNADWNASSGLAEILNKPTIPAAQVNSDWNAASGVAQILNKPTLATVATTGSYDDLIDQPSIPKFLNNLGDVEVPTPATNDLFYYNGTEWVNIQGKDYTESNINLDNLKNVITAGATNGSVLTYESISGQWKPQTPSGGGGGILHGTAAGTDTFTVTITGATPYADGDAYLIRFTNGNTTSCTLNINGLGAVPLYRNNDGALIGGDIWAGAEMLCIYNSTTSVFQCIGTSSNSLFAYVTNAEGSTTITKGQPVYAFGGTGDRLTVKLAFNTTDATSAQTVGMVVSTSIAPNQKGIIIVAGQLDNLNTLPTSTFADGDAIYLGATAGSITNVKPSAPNHLVYLGIVTTASPGSAGRMYVRVQNGYELQELHNVVATAPANNDYLYYDASTSLYRLRQLTATRITDSTTVGQNLVKLTNPNAITFLRVNADNSVTARTPAQVLTDLGVAATIILARDFGTYTLTSSTTNTLVWSAAIAANTFQSNDMIEWFSQMNTNAGNGVRVDYRLYINTSASLVGAQLIGTSFNTVGTGNLMIGRNIFVTASGVSGNLRVTSNAANAASSFGNSSVNATNITIDTTITQYLIIAIQHQTTVPTSSVVSTLIRTTR
jgi:hypothetical protein